MLSLELLLTELAARGSQLFLNVQGDPALLYADLISHDGSARVASSLAAVQ